MTRDRRTLAIWLVSLANLSVAGLIAAAFATMAFGLDPSEIVTAGVEPWSNAAIAAAAFAGLVVATGVSLWLWHFTRWHMIALIMTAVEVGGVVWSCVTVYSDYF